uniref:Tigger transposable element-derived protein 6-like n=1 Tax=Saccoglossus kowalevskii TaxID=10224 RepID=A0ABM0GR16_SACKO|nr:PREDICTED: tigger transposable element-derived protein 6-like [Saccoglossus kowalevskii]
MSRPPQKRRRVELTLADKVKLMKDSESTNLTRQQLGQKYGIGKSTVTDIIKKKADYMKQFENNIDGSRQRIKTSSKFEEINGLVWTWFQQARAKHIPISGPMLQEKALSFASELGVQDFKASNGWLESWRGRYSIKSFKVNGESADVDLEVVEDFKQRIGELCEGYRPEDIFNTDETGVYFRALPDRTLGTKSDDCKGGKVSKERLTALFTCSMTGEKIKPFVIGKAAKPRCFKNIDPKTLPVYWNSNKKAWMTSALFEEYLRDLNNQMRRKRRKILLFLDNATSHCPNIRLSHVTLKFFPANTTSVLQPLDQGIIRAFKARYRKRLLRSVIAKIDTESSASGFNQLDSEITDVEEADDTEEIRNLINEVTGPDVQCTVDEYLNFDDNMPTEETYDGEWEQQILENFIEDKENQDCLDDDTESSENQIVNECDEGSDMTHQDVLHMLTKIKNFAINKDSCYLTAVQDLQTMTERKIVQKRCSLRQSTLDSFFTP